MRPILFKVIGLPQGLRLDGMMEATRVVSDGDEVVYKKVLAYGSVALFNPGDVKQTVSVNGRQLTTYHKSSGEIYLEAKRYWGKSGSFPAG